MAAIRTVGDSSVGNKRGKYFFDKSLTVKISARLGQTLCCTLKRTKEKVIHMENVADKIRILYGGSVKPSTIEEQMSQSDIDGALIGGASLTAESFNEIIANTMKVSV